MQERVRGVRNAMSSVLSPPPLPAHLPANLSATADNTGQGATSALLPPSPAGGGTDAPAGPSKASHAVSQDEIDNLKELSELLYVGHDFDKWNKTSRNNMTGPIVSLNTRGGTSNNRALYS